MAEDEDLKKQADFNSVAENESVPYTQENQNDEYEYEYVELAEGEELPEGVEYEYEYVEVSADDAHSQAQNIQPAFEAEVPTEVSVLSAPETNDIVTSPANSEAVSSSVETEINEDIEASAVEEFVPAPVLPPKQKFMNEPVTNNRSYDFDDSVSQVENYNKSNDFDNSEKDVLEPNHDELSLDDMLGDVTEKSAVVSIDDNLSDIKDDFFEKELFGVKEIKGIEEVLFEDNGPQSFIQRSPDEYLDTPQDEEEEVSEYVEAEMAEEDNVPAVAELVQVEEEPAAKIIPAEPIVDDVEVPVHISDYEDNLPENVPETRLGGTDDEVWFNDNPHVEIQSDETSQISEMNDENDINNNVSEELPSSNIIEDVAPAVTEDEAVAPIVEDTVSEIAADTLEIPVVESVAYGLSENQEEAETTADNMEVLEPVIEAASEEVPADMVSEHEEIIPVEEERNGRPIDVDFKHQEPAAVVEKAHEMIVEAPAPISSPAEPSFEIAPLVQEPVEVQHAQSSDAIAETSEIIPEPAAEKNSILETQDASLVLEAEVPSKTAVDEADEIMIGNLVDDNEVQSEAPITEAIQEAPIVVQEIKPKIQEENIVINNIIPEFFDISEEEYTNLVSASQLVDKSFAIQHYDLTKEKSFLALNNVDFAHNELASWKLIIFDSKIVPIHSDHIHFDKNEEAVRFASIIKNGNKKLDLFNETDFNFVQPSDNFKAVNGKFICGDTANSGLIINDMICVPLEGQAGKIVEFGSSVRGVLTGPNGTVIFFNNMKGLVIPDGHFNTVDEDKAQSLINRWYSGSVNDKYFDFSASSQSSEFVGNDEVNSIHVNIGNSTYGWNITFDDGLVMSLRDLREYQTKHGKLPMPDGVISFGQLTCKFKNVERIVVYETAQYFSYTQPK